MPLVICESGIGADVRLSVFETRITPYTYFTTYLYKILNTVDILVAIAFDSNVYKSGTSSYLPSVNLNSAPAMGSSKKKSSFRIDDLLQQQTKIASSSSNGQYRHHPFYAQHLSEATAMSAYHQSAFPGATNNNSSRATSSNGSSNSQSQSSFVSASNNHKTHHHYNHHQPPPPPAAHHPKHHHQVTQHRHESSPSSSDANLGKHSPSSPTFADGVTNLAPHKPMPMYVPAPQPPPNAMMDLHKASLSFPPIAMTMPPPYSHHAAAAYLEHYANSFQKGRHTWDFI